MISIVSPHHDRRLKIGIELNELPRPQTAHTRALRSTRGPGTTLQQIRAPTSYREVNVTS
jgi:hypothetical protein